MNDLKTIKEKDEHSELTSPLSNTNQIGMSPGK